MKFDEVDAHLQRVLLEAEAFAFDKLALSNSGSKNEESEMNILQMRIIPSGGE